MASATQTIKRQLPNPSRTHDYLYDKSYILSSERDHARATFQAHTDVSRIKRVPEYKTMFSELRHHPRFSVRLDVTDPVPKFIGREWRGYADQHREAVSRYTTFNYDPSVQVPQQDLSDFNNAQVTGRNRYLYAKRPIIPFLQQVPPEVLLATARQDPLAGPDNVIAERAPTPLTKTIETQTDYRDSEAQTDPYTPEYVVRPGEAPELLTLATLSFGRGLPAGLAEVEMIERARTKRAWEATLPPLNDVSQLEKRRKMMDEMERQEWALREQEIEKLQQARLDVLKQLLKQREENHQELNIKRLDKLWAIKQKNKEHRIKKIRNEHIKSIRKMTERRSQIENGFQRRNVIEEYANPGSQTYAPLTRIGVFLDRGSEQYLVKSRHLSTYQGLLELEASLPDFVIQPRIKAPKPSTVTKSGFIKRRYRKERELSEVYEANAINDLAYAVEDSRDQLESEEIVADLVHCFLIPEAKKQTVREKVRRTQRRFLLAAHAEIHHEGSDLIAVHNRQKIAEAEQRKAAASPQPPSSMMPSAVDLTTAESVTDAFSTTMASAEGESEIPASLEKSKIEESPGKEPGLGDSAAAEPSKESSFQQSKDDGTSSDVKDEK
ncbi:cilia- and flagella-associated protein 91 [Plakobranchus ocellatus]|uniref:Cilia- and flagella-associated protein 91 n=1 Tax=Plakobranchus ocellatus TaxID=259542 RepID=A0AAV4BC52_9GAST|nr:cilia- and flagella-associated protein 91 [Plakobranchus ocellatus]